MKLKIEINAISNSPLGWDINISAEGIRLGNGLLKDLPDIVEKHVKEVYYSKKKSVEIKP